MKILIVIFIIIFSQTAYAKKKDITNLNFKPSVAKGKIGNSYEIVKVGSGEPVIGKSAYKFVAIPFDCGKDDKHTDCGEVVLYKENSYRSKGDRVRSELSSGEKTFKGEKWFTISIYLPEDYKTISPAITSFYQIYEKDGGPAFKIEDFYGIMVGSIMHSGKLITKIKLLEIDKMRGKWTHIVMNNNYSKKKDKGFYNIWVNSKYKSSFNGQTYGSSTTRGLYVKAGIYQTYLSRYLKKIGMNPKWKKGQAAGDFPTQIIFMDNIFKYKSKEKLKKKIAKVYKDLEIPIGFDFENLKISKTSNENSGKFYAVVFSKSDPSAEFIAYDTSKSKANIKAMKKCFEKYDDCTIGTSYQLN